MLQQIFLEQLKIIYFESIPKEVRMVFTKARKVLHVAWKLLFTLPLYNHAYLEFTLEKLVNLLHFQKSTTSL